MPKFIAHHDGWFFEWSTIVDAPTTEAMTREEFEQYYRDEYGRQAMDTLPQRLSRAIETGSSSLDGDSLADLVSGNRAGPDETELSLDGIIKLVMDMRANCMTSEQPW